MSLSDVSSTPSFHFFFPICVGSLFSVVLTVRIAHIIFANRTRFAVLGNRVRNLTGKKNKTKQELASTQWTHRLLQNEAYCVFYMFSDFLASIYFLFLFNSFFESKFKKETTQQGSWDLLWLKAL
jgi:ATP/ADP translocase